MDNTYLVISRLLSGHMPGHAFALTRVWAADVLKSRKLYPLRDRLESLQKNYGFAVDYFMSDRDDPYREEMVESLIHDAYVLLDEIYLEKRLSESTSYEFRQMLQFQAQPVSPHVQSEDDLDGPPQVFRFFWLTKQLEEFDLDVLGKYVDNPAMEEEAQLGLSGVTLNLLRTFSEAGVLFLIRVCSTQHDMSIMERAWVGLVLVMLHYDNRLRYFPKVMNAFLDMIGTDEGMAWALHALSALVRTSGVEWASGSFSKLQGELYRRVNQVFPLKNGANIISHSLQDMDDFTKGISEELSSLIEERRNAMIRLREDHLDANYAIYRGLYTTPFFSDPFHWWLPYDLDYLRNENDLKIAGQLEKYFPDDLCESDKFALVTALATFTNGNLPDGLPTPAEGTEEKEIVVCNAYMQQAYRFFTLNPWGIDNIFQEVTALPESQFLRLLRPTAQDKIYVADQFLACHCYEAALELYQANSRLVSSAEVWRNYGLCLQKTGSLKDAVSAYDMSLDMEVSEWALRQKAWCLMQKQTQQYDEALQVLDQLLTRHPEDPGYLFEKGKCLEHMELYVEALEIYCKLEVLHPGNAQVMRAIAWCSFLIDDTEQAEHYYKKLISTEKKKLIDYLNYGHLLFAKGLRSEAFRHYMQSMTMSNSLKDFLNLFRPDRRILVEKGIPTADIYMMEDQLITTYHNKEKGA